MVSSIPTITSTYTVREGDTLSQIAQRNNTTVDNILMFNKNISNPDEIGIGDKIIIPTEKKAKQETTPPIHAEGDYKIKAGDTLSQIAQRYKTTVKKILMFNKKISNPDKIGIGDTIIIPTEKKAKKEATPPIHAEGDYKIKAGDTLFSTEKELKEKSEYELTEKELKEESKLMEPWFNTLAEHAKQREIELKNQKSATLETSDIDDKKKDEITTRYIQAYKNWFGEYPSHDFSKTSTTILERDAKYWEDSYKKYGDEYKEAMARENATF